MKIRNILVAFIVFPVLLYCLENQQKDKSSSSNIIKNIGVWLDETASTFNFYADPSLPDSFRFVIQSVCDDLEPMSVIGDHFNLNYTGLESTQNFEDNICQITYSDYGFEFVAKACNKYSPEAYSPNGLYFGIETKFDVLINDNYTYVTGQFTTPNVYDRASTLRHEFGHGVAGLAHNDYSPMMKSETVYNNTNPERVVTATDITNYHALYNPAEITNPPETAEDYYEVLLVNGNEINLEATKPAVVNTVYADLDFYLFNEDYTYDVAHPQSVEIDRDIEYLSSKYSYTWILDTTKVTNKTYKVISTYSGFYPSPDYIASYPHDELKIRFSELTFDSPQKDQRYSVSTPLNFKVFGKSASADVDISEIANISTVTYKLEEGGVFGSTVFETETDESTNFELTENLVNYNIDQVDYLVTVTVKNELGGVLATIEKMPIKLYIPVNIEAPLSGEIKYVRPSGGKGAVTDSILIKVKVPVVFGAYPPVKIKIDGTYVNQGEIIFNTTENVWVYDWDLDGIAPTIYGKKYIITAEIDIDSTSRSVTSVYLVESVFHEDFQTVTNLETAGWVITEYAYPPASQAANGWMIGPDPLYVVGNKCGRSYSTYSTSFTYKLYTPTFTVPDSSIIKTKLKYRIYYKKLNSPNSYIYFDVCNASGTPLTTTQMLGPTYNLWIDINYDLSKYSGQTIKLRWNHLYTDGINYCNSTNYALDDILVYTLPDTNAPIINYFAGNSAELNEDMNLSLGFNDDSEVGDVTADYTIDGESGSVTLNPPKNSYTYTGIIPAKDHACSGTIVFKVTDSVGNETISSPYGIYWAEGSGILTAPENVVISQPTSTTVSITWDLVPGATSYKVFSSTDPYGTFTEDTTGTFTESRKWEKTIDGNKYFYYVIAVNSVKEGTFEISKAGEDK